MQGHRFKCILKEYFTDSIGLIDKTTKRKLKLSPLAGWLESSESVDLWLLKSLTAVEQHVGIWRLHKAVRYLSDRRVVKTVPGLSQGVVAQSCVVTHVKMTCVVLEK